MSSYQSLKFLKVSSRYVIVFLITVLSANVMAIGLVKDVDLKHDQAKIRLILESNRPISYGYNINERSRLFTVELQGADYYAALTEYFQQYDIDRLAGCLDEIAIVPLAEDAAKLEVTIGEGMMASVFDDTANSKRNFRVVIQFVAVNNDSDCFSNAGSQDQNQQDSNEESMSIADMAAEIEREAQAQNNSTGRPAEFSTDTDIPPTTEPELKIESNGSEKERFTPTSTKTDEHNFTAFLATDFLLYKNKGGFKGDEWLFHSAHHEIREVKLDASGWLASYPYQLATRTTTNQNEEKDTILYRASIGVPVLESWQIFAGVVAEPFSGNSGTELEVSAFLEKSVSANISPTFGPGVLARYTDGENIQWDTGVFGKRSDDAADTKQSITTRFSYSLNNTESSYSNVSLAYSTRKPIDGKVDIGVRPDSHLIEPLFNVNETDIESVTTSGLSARYNSDELGIGSEIVNSQLKANGASTVEKIGAQSFWLSWFWTGESRKIKNGLVQRIEPLTPMGGNGWGAIETTLRYSRIFDDQNQELSNVTLGLNWYINRYAQMKINYVFLNDVATTIDTVDNDGDVVEARLQISYW